MTKTLAHGLHKESLRFSGVLRKLFYTSIFTLAAALPAQATTVSIVGDEFHIDGQPTYKGITWNGSKIEGLLFNSRMVNGIFDDRNPATVNKWAYADTGHWDAARNTREFVAAMPAWKQKGLLAITVNLQGGSPQGYSQAQPWENTAFNPDGTLRQDYLTRLNLIVEKANSLGMVVILGYFYSAQDQRLTNEAAVKNAVDNATKYVLAQKWNNVLIEINNECSLNYDHDILRPARVDELIQRAKAITLNGKHLLVATSYYGKLPSAKVVAVSDYFLLHGNGKSADKLTRYINGLRQIPGYTKRPVVINEDDHYAFDQAQYNMKSAVLDYASWGFFDYRRKGESANEGFQSMPADWRINSPRKIAFFNKVAEMTKTK